MNGQQDLLTMLAMDVEKETIVNAENADETYEVLDDYLSRQRSIPRQMPHVVLIGGGIISLMTAFFLNEYGFEISIIEKQSVGAAASGRNGGAVMMLGRELSEVPFARHSIKLWEQLSNKGIHTLFERKGQLMVARNEVETEKLKQAYELYKAAGIPVSSMDHNDMKNYTPHLGNHIKFGIFSHEDSQSYPFTTIQSLMRVLISKGVKFYPYTEAEAFETKNNFINGVVIKDRVIKGDYYIICAGPWTSQICAKLNEHVVIKPRRSQLMVTEIIRERVVQPFFTGNGIYLRQSHAGNILFGGGGPWETNGYEVNNTSYAMQLLSTRFIELFPSFASMQLIRAFAGTVEITPDHLPAFGRLPSWENAFISAGYNGHGYGVSAIMGKLMGALLFDHATGALLDNDIQQIIDPMRIDRFKQMITA